MNAGCTSERLGALLNDLTFTGEDMSCLEASKARHSHGATLLRVSQFIPENRCFLTAPTFSRHIETHTSTVRERNADYDFT